MKIVKIDCSVICDRDSFHDAAAEALAFSDWYGRNLDAFHDLLTAIAEDTSLQLLHWNAAEAALGNYASAIKRVLAHAVKRNPRLSVEYCE